MCGKIPHETREEARWQRVSLRLTGNKRRIADLEIYRCPECDSWHVGHRHGTPRTIPIRRWRKWWRSPFVGQLIAESS